MAEDKRANPYPYVTPEEFAESDGTREEKGARCIAASQFGGIPTRAFLLGDNDHAPVMKGVRAFVTEVYRLVDLIDAGNLDDRPAEPPSEEQWTRIVEKAGEVVMLMEDPRCQTSPES